MAADPFAPLDQALEELLGRVGAGERSTLGKRLGTTLRDANAKRLRANVTPDGAAMAPRKRPSTDRRKAADRMFRRAAGAAHLRRESSAGEVLVGFVGAAARIMRVHHYGLRDRVERKSGAPEVTYETRPVIGLSTEDRARMLEQVAAHVVED